MKRGTKQECTEHKIILCPEEKTVLRQIQRDYEDKTGEYLPLPEAIKVLIKGKHER